MEVDGLENLVNFHLADVSRSVDFKINQIVAGIYLVTDPGKVVHLITELHYRGLRTETGSINFDFDHGWYGNGSTGIARLSQAKPAGCPQTVFQFDRWGASPYSRRPFPPRYFMANIRSAEKDIRKTTVRTAHNQTVKSRIRTLRKKVIAALDKKDAAAAAACLSEFASATDKAAKTKVLKKNTSSRLKSRLAVKVSALTK